MPQTTYIFGAGASKHAGYPLASTMASELLAWINTTDELWVRQHRCRAATRLALEKCDNIEELFKELDERKLASVLDFLPQLILVWFKQIRQPSAHSYGVFAESVISDGDSALTFNYDEALERELRRVSKWDVSDGYSFPFGKNREPQSRNQVFKLHGSINWHIPSNLPHHGYGQAYPGAMLQRRPSIQLEEVEYLGCRPIVENIVQPGTGVLPVLVVPKKDKEFFYSYIVGTGKFREEFKEFDEFWDALWNHAANELRCSSKVVICGYSLPAADERARELLFDNIPKAAAIEVVCGNDSDRIMEEFNAARFEDVKSCPIFFEEWVKRRAEAQL